MLNKIIGLCLLFFPWGQQCIAQTKTEIRFSFIELDSVLTVFQGIDYVLEDTVWVKNDEVRYWNRGTVKVTFVGEKFKSHTYFVNVNDHETRVLRYPTEKDSLQNQRLNPQFVAINQNVSVFFVTEKSNKTFIDGEFIGMGSFAFLLPSGTTKHVTTESEVFGKRSFKAEINDKSGFLEIDGRLNNPSTWSKVPGLTMVAQNKKWDQAVRLVPFLSASVVFALSPYWYFHNKALRENTQRILDSFERTGGLPEIIGQNPFYRENLKKYDRQDFFVTYSPFFFIASAATMKFSRWEFKRYQKRFQEKYPTRHLSIEGIPIIDPNGKAVTLGASLSGSF